MAKKKEEVKAPVTRAEKKDATKNIVRELLQKESFKSNDLIDETAKVYTQRYAGEDTENVNDVKGRAGSVIDIMKKEGELTFDGGRYALKAQETAPEEQPKKARGKKAKEEKVAEKAAEKEAKKAAKVEKAKKEKATPLPPPPLQPIAPVDPTTPEAEPKPAPKKRGKKAAEESKEAATEKAEPKKRGRKAKTEKAEAQTAEETAEEKLQEKPLTQPQEEMQAEQPVESIKTEEAQTKKDTSPKGTLMDMSFLFGAVKADKDKEAKKAEKEVKPKDVQEQKKAEQQKPAKKAEEKAPETKKLAQKPVSQANNTRQKQTSEERLKEAFLKKIGWLGGDYFEYYSVYLLERYSMKNGRRLEGLKISGGERDGGIDGELELTDKLGFRETIYIQAKNWHPDKTDDKLWVVGETLLQQFIGACAHKKVKDGKQHCRGIFITTSRFTQEAKRLLDDMSDVIVGYDGDDLYEAAKECEFGVVKKNGEWALDEKLLSGMNAFFRQY